MEVYTKPLRPSLEFQVRKATQFGYNKHGVYEMNSKNRGVLFFVNIIKFDQDKHDERLGAELDRENLLHLYDQMGFKIFYYENITSTVSK